MSKAMVDWDFLASLMKSGIIDRDRDEIEKWVTLLTCETLDFIDEAKNGIPKLIGKPEDFKSVKASFEDYGGYDDDPSDGYVWVHDPESELPEMGFHPASVVAKVHGSYGDGPCYGFRYFLEADQAIPSLIREAFISDAMLVSEGYGFTDSDLEESVSSWEEALLNASMLLIDRDMSPREKTKRLGGIVSTSMSLDFNVESLLEHVKNFPNTTKSLFEELFKEPWYTFDKTNESHWLWALKQMKPSHWGM